MADNNIKAGLDKLIRRISSEQGFKDCKLEIIPVSSGGANYSSTLYKAKVEDNENAINLFVKVAVMTTEAIVDAGLVSMGISPYDVEKHFCGEVSKIYKNMEDNNHIPQEDRYTLPKYYGANTDETRDMLVFEDLGAKGFTTYDRLKSIDWPYASAAVKELAKFHALSMAYEKYYPENYEHFTNKFSFPGFTEDIFNVFFLSTFKRSIEAARVEIRENVKKFLDEITFAEFVKMYQPVTKKVLIHTDYRPSNLMHRYREDGTVQVIPLDYQTCQVGCPVIDLLYLVFVGSDEEFRRQYFNQLWEYYYTELSAAMTRLGVDNSRYSRKDFDQDLKVKLKYGLVLAAMVLPVVTVDPNEAPTITDDLNQYTQYKTSEHLAMRMNGVIDDFIRWQIL